jgi:hypothetical protein
MKMTKFASIVKNTRVLHFLSPIVILMLGSFAFTVSSWGQGGSTQVNLSSAFNQAGMYTDGHTFASNGGLANSGYAYSATLLGSSQNWNGQTFNLGPANTSNVVYGSGQTITLPSGQYSTLQMLATGVNGGQTSQTFTVTYSDQSTSQFTQSLSDWVNSSSYSGESIAKTMAYYNTYSGGQNNNGAHLYGYSFAINNAKTVKSVTLPNNANVIVAAITLGGGGSSSPTISLSPTSLSFSATQGGGNPSAQNVTVSNSGGGTLAAPTTQINYSQGSGWLSVNCTGSSAPYTCSTQPATGSLAAGTYNATVQVSSSGATNTPQSYTVAFTVNSGSVCTITTAMGTCGPYSDSSISLTYQSQTQNDVWGPPATWSQTLYTTNPGSWYVIANYPTDPSGAVHTYPSMTIQYCCSGSENPALDSYSYMYSSLSTTPDTSSTTKTDAGYDNWMNDWANEVMIQTQLINSSSCTGYFLHTVATNVQFGGSYGIPVNTWNLCQGSNYPGTVELVWQITGPNGSTNFGDSSISVDIYAMLKYLEGNTACYSSSGPGTACLPAGSTFTQTTFGWEISGTGSLSKQFTVNSLTFTASH